jgi:glycosyltransferase involved in cell wall biosynthesis
VRITFVNPVGVLGGGERSLLDLIASLRRAEPSVALQLVVLSAGPLVGRARELGATVDLVPMPEGLLSLGEFGIAGGRGLAAVAARAGAAALSARAATRFILALRRAIDAFAPDLVHSNGMKAHLLTAAIRSPRIPLVWHLRDFIGDRPLTRIALRAARFRADAAICNSDAVADDARAVLPGMRIERVYNAVDVDAFSPGPADDGLLDELAGVSAAPAGTVRVGMVATYARWKGQDVFLDAAARILARGGEPAIRFYIVGGPIYERDASQFSEAELRAAARRHGLGSRIAFVPFQDDLPRVYRALDVVVHAATRREPFGRTIVEAMACGRAAIVVRGGGSVELFTDGVDALGCVPSNADSLADAVRRLVESPTLRARIGSAARASAASRFSRDRLAREVMSVYRRVLDRH